MKVIKQTKSLTEQAYEILLDKICVGELESGMRLNQDNLAKDLDISRQPVNSAISILKSNGFVEETGRRGVVVSPITSAHLNSIYEFRSAIEPLAVQLAADRKPSSADRDAVKILERGWNAVNSGNLNEQVQADFEFHSLIYGWTQNSFLINAMKLNWNHIRRGMCIILGEGDYPPKAWDEHERMIMSLLKGHVPVAVTEMKEHIENAKKITISLMQNQ